MHRARETPHRTLLCSRAQAVPCPARQLAPGMLIAKNPGGGSDSQCRRRINPTAGVSGLLTLTRCLYSLRISFTRIRKDWGLSPHRQMLPPGQLLQRSGPGYFQLQGPGVHSASMDCRSPSRTCPAGSFPRIRDALQRDGAGGGSAQPLRALSAHPHSMAGGAVNARVLTAFRRGKTRCREDGSCSALNSPVTLRRDSHRTAGHQGGQEPPAPQAGLKVNMIIQISDPSNSPKAPAASASSAVALRFSTGPNVRGG